MGNFKKHSAIFIAIFSLVTFIVLLPSILSIDHISGLDLFVENSMPSLWSPELISFFLFITQIGNISVLLPLSVALFLFLAIKRHVYESYLFATAMFLGTFLVLALKELTKIPRLANALVTENSFSFPSAHTAMTTIFFLTLGYIFGHRIKNSAARFIFEAVCVSVIALVGFSRIYLSVHRPSEVFAGFLLGVFCVSISTILCHKLCNRKLNQAS